MSEPIQFHFNIDGEDFTSAGKASVQVKKLLRQLSFDADTIRRVSVAMYEGEINMVIHANGGRADVVVWDEKIEVILADTGPGIPMCPWQCRKDIQQRRRISAPSASAPAWVCRI